MIRAYVASRKVYKKQGHQVQDISPALTNLFSFLRKRNQLTALVRSTPIYGHIMRIANTGIVGDGGTHTEAVLTPVTGTAVEHTVLVKSLRVSLL